MQIPNILLCFAAFEPVNVCYYIRLYVFCQEDF